jgi:predicted protein tyrosine phosphatase
MQPLSITMLTVCGIEELTLHGGRGVTHVLSILDPEEPDPQAFRSFGEHHRTLLRFHDEIEPRPGIVLPAREHVAEIIAFGRSLADTAERDREGHLLVHCHAGISRSTAAMATLLAQVYPQRDEASIFARVLAMRPKAWPNSRMIGYADEMLGRDGRMLNALGRLYARQLITFPNTARFMQENSRSREVAMAAEPALEAAEA